MLSNTNNPAALGRREFLTLSIGAFLGAETVASEVDSALKSTSSKEALNIPENEHVSNHNEPTRLNLLSAHAVSVGFLATLSDATLRNSGHITLHHAGVVNSLEGMRLTALVCGESPDRYFAANEMLHLFKDSFPALFMIAASDFAERGISLDPSIMAGRLRQNGEHRIIETQRLAKERPEICLEAQELWASHRNVVVSRLTERVTEMVAITSIAAPFATTLTSSAFWKDGFDDVAHLCMELALADQVVESIKQGKDPANEIVDIKSRAAIKATELLNGSWGYNQLGIALACNGQGLFGIGTPPNLWFAFNHLAKDPVGCVLSEIKGMAFSETQTLVASAIWLSRAVGNGFFETCRQLASNQVSMLAIIKNSLTEKELRATTFGSGSQLAKRILPILNQARSDIPLDILLGDIRQEIRETPIPALQLSLGEWVERMKSVYERIARRFPIIKDQVGEIADITAEELDQIESLRSGQFYKSLTNAVTEREDKVVNAHLEKLQRWKQGRLSQKIAVLLHTIAAHGEDDDFNYDRFIKSFGLSSEIHFEHDSFAALSDEKSSALTGELRILSWALEQVASFSSTNERLHSSQLLYREGVDIDSILRQLGYVHRETFKEACHLLVNIKIEPENIRQSVSEPAINQMDHSHPEYQGHAMLKLMEWLRDTWNDPRNLSEPSRDIVRVIATQLPAIPAFSISIVEVLKKYAEVKPGESLDQSQLSAILKVIPAFGFGIAALADNVPGYLILEKVLTDLFSQTFNSETLSGIPHLGTRIGFICKILASQSGMVLPFSSATNLLQDKVEVVVTDDPEYPQGLAIRRSKLTAPDTFLSGYMGIAAAGTIAYAAKAFNDLFIEVQKRDATLSKEP